MDSARFWITSSDGKFIGSVGLLDDKSQNDEANARPMAAAPEMLDVLEQVYAGMEDGSINDSGAPIPNFVQRIIEKAK